MDFSTITQFISSVGFPIVACCFMAWFCYYQIKIRREDNKELAEMQKESMAKLTESVDNNTELIKNLIAKIEKASE